MAFFFLHSWGKSKQYKIHTLIHLTEVTCCGKEMGYGYHCIMANWKGSHLDPLVISCEDANYLSYKPCQKTFCEDRALFVHPIVHCTVDHSFLKAHLSSSIFVRPSLQKQSFNRNIVYCALQMEVVCKSPWARLKYGITYMCFTNMFIYLTTQTHLHSQRVITSVSSWNPSLLLFCNCSWWQCEQDMRR